MNKGLMYRHENTKTVAMQVLTSYYSEERARWSVRVLWYKWSPTRGLEHCLNISERLLITREQRKGWKILSE